MPFVTGLIYSTHASPPPLTCCHPALTLFDQSQISLLLLFSRQIICLLNYHIDFSTIPVTLIVKFWSKSRKMISTDTMKEDSLNDYKGFDLKLDAIFINQPTWYLFEHAHVYTRTWKCWYHNKICEEIHSYNNEFKTY